MKPRGCVSSYQNSLSLENTTDAGRSSTSLDGMHTIEHIERIQGIGVFVSTQSISEILIQMVNINRGTHWEGIIIEDNLSFG